MPRSSLIDLVNAALVSIGQEPIVSLENNEGVSSVVTVVKAKIDVIRREMLRENDWNCARKTAKLAELSDKTIYGWKHAFQLPKDPECLRVVQISLDQGKSYIDLDEYYNSNKGPIASLFDQDGDILLCNSDNIFIKYTADIDPALFDPSLAAAFVAQLAAELAYTLPASVTLADYMSRVARQKLKKAKSLNARERNILSPEGDVIGIRYREACSHIRVDMSDEME